MELWTAFTIGLVGSLHCIGMCGPIALALPYQGGNRWTAAGNLFLYNTGRVVTYSLLGALIGLVGKGLFISGFQSHLSIGLGIFLLLVAIFSINVESKLQKIPAIGRLNNWVKRNLAKLLHSNGPRPLFLIGLLNGLLPCGLVYVGVAGAVTMGSILSGMAYMALFGLGTIPMMWGASLAGQLIDVKWRNRMRKLAPAFLVFFALLFIFRGLNFDVPVDLRFWENLQEAPMCH